VTKPTRADKTDKTDEGDENDEGAAVDQGDENAPSDQAVEMTPEIDAGFARIAQERIARHPFRYYAFVAPQASTLPLV